MKTKTWEIRISKELLEENVNYMCSTHQEFFGKRALPENQFRFYAFEFQEKLLECYGEGAVAEVRISKLFGKVTAEFRIPGPMADPIGNKMEETWYSRYYMRNYSKEPVYRYDAEKQINIITLEPAKLPKKNNMMLQILEALGLAILCFFLLRLLPGDVCDTVIGDVIDPVFSKITAVLSGGAMPLIFVSVIGGIIGMGSSAAFSAICKRFLSGMFLTYGVAGVILVCFSLPVYGFQFSKDIGEEGTFLKQIVTLVLDIVPNNMVSCFAESNGLQVIVLAIFLGVVLLLLGEKVSQVREAVALLETILCKVMQVICKLLPVVMFCGTFKILSMDVQQLIQVYKVVVGFVLCSALVIVFVMIRVRIRTGGSIRKLFKAQAATTMMNLTTSSQMGTMPENMRCCREDFGIEEQLLNFCMPLGIVTYMPTGAVFLGLSAFCMADFTGIPLLFSDYIKIAVISIVIAIAAPPIPGSAFVVMPILFSACSIPLTYYSLAILLGTCLGYFTPMLNGYCLQLEILLIAHKMKKIDEERFARFKARGSK